MSLERAGDRIFLQGVSFRGFHGVFPEERRDGQRFEVDLELRRSCAAAGASDRLQDTIDYGKLAELIVQVGTGERCRLVERLATRIAERIQERYPGVSLLVTVRKFPEGLPGSPRVAGVTLVR